jgi:hypothetical protein
MAHPKSSHERIGALCKLVDELREVERLREEVKALSASRLRSPDLAEKERGGTGMKSAEIIFIGPCQDVVGID